MRRYVSGNSIQEVWTYLLGQLLRHAEYVPTPRGIATREILGVTIHVNDLRNNIIHHPVRNMNYRFMVAEWLWITFGHEDLATLVQYNGQMSRFSDDGKALAGAYGPRLSTQWRYVLDTLRRDPDTRQAVATIWTPNPAPSKDIPCTLSLQFIARDGKLNLIVTMRSSDVWLGIPYDVFTFSQIANSIAGELCLEPGFLQMQLGSSHLYDDNVEKVMEVLKNSQPSGFTSPRLSVWPPMELERQLVNPTGTNILYEPWATYARVLHAETWKEAYRLLRTLE